MIRKPYICLPAFGTAMASYILYFCTSRKQRGEKNLRRCAFWTRTKMNQPTAKSVIAAADMQSKPSSKGPAVTPSGSDLCDLVFDPSSQCLSLSVSDRKDYYQIKVTREDHLQYPWSWPTSRVASGVGCLWDFSAWQCQEEEVRQVEGWRFIPDEEVNACPQTLVQNLTGLCTPPTRQRQKGIFAKQRYMRRSSMSFSAAVAQRVHTRSRSHQCRPCLPRWMRLRR